MDWNLKIPSWDFTEFEQGTIPNIDSAGGSSSYGGQGIKGNFSVDLKLGQVIDSGNELRESLKATPSISKMALSPSGSSKRARPINNAIQAASCLVDGCNADLSNSKEYHRRHKVCEVHSKAPQVSINGQKQRFCQQCSRFHSLEEFDEGKRSCRKRLDGHNRRRRRPQLDSSRVASLFAGHQGLLQVFVRFNHQSIEMLNAFESHDGFCIGLQNRKPVLLHLRFIWRKSWRQKLRFSREPTSNPSIGIFIRKNGKHNPLIVGENGEQEP